MSEAGKLVLDLIALHHAVLGNDFFQQHAKLRNVPLSVAQRVKKSAVGVLRAHLECRIEGAARGDHAQLFVEHKNRLADSVDNALRERTGICDVDELLSEIGYLHSAVDPLRTTNEKPGRSAAGVAGLRPGQPVAQLCLRLADLNQRVCAKLTTFAASLLALSGRGYTFGDEPVDRLIMIEEPSLSGLSDLARHHALVESIIAFHSGSHCSQSLRITPRIVSSGISAPRSA